MAVTWFIGPAYNIAYMAPSAAIRPEDGQCTVYSEWPDPVTQSAVGVITIVVQFVLPLILLVCGYVSMAVVLHRLVVAVAERSRQGNSSSYKFNQSISQSIGLLRNGSQVAK